MSKQYLRTRTLVLCIRCQKECRNVSYKLYHGIRQEILKMLYWCHIQNTNIKTIEGEPYCMQFEI